MLCRVRVLVAFVGLAALPSILVAEDVELKVDWSLKGASTQGPEITITNVSSQEIEVQHPANRHAIAFLVMNERGNPVPPVGVAKVDPMHRTIKLKPGEAFAHTLDGRTAHAKGLTFPFLAGTALFAYDLGDGADYRVIMIYRPQGMAGHGIASTERGWTSRHDEGKASDSDDSELAKAVAQAASKLRTTVENCSEYKLINAKMICVKGKYVWLVTYKPAKLLPEDPSTAIIGAGGEVFLSVDLKSGQTEVRYGE